MVATTAAAVEAQAKERQARVAKIDWSLARSSRRIATYRAVGDERSLAIELMVADRLLAERRAST